MPRIIRPLLRLRTKQLIKTATASHWIEKNIFEELSTPSLIA